MVVISSRRRTGRPGARHSSLADAQGLAVLECRVAGGVLRGRRVAGASCALVRAGAAPVLRGAVECQRAVRLRSGCEAEPRAKGALVQVDDEGPRGGRSGEAPLRGGGPLAELRIAHESGERV